MAEKKAKLGLIQVSGQSIQSVQESQNEMLYLAEQCLIQGADLVFMPECNQYRGVSNISPRDLALQYADAYKEKCKRLAQKYKAYVVLWDYELTAEGVVHNTSYVLDRQGNEIGKYRKTHLTYEEEFAGITKGDKFPVFNLDFARVGIMICFDNYFPECARILALNGAELILFPLYGDTLINQWEIKAKARAIDNTVYVAPCHIKSPYIGEEISYTGLIDPNGEVVTKLQDEGTYQVVEFEPNKKKITCTLAKEGQYEDIKAYLLKSRNTQAYASILDERKVLGWEDIIIKEK